MESTPLELYACFPSHFSKAALRNSNSLSSAFISREVASRCELSFSWWSLPPSSKPWLWLFLWHAFHSSQKLPRQQASRVGCSLAGKVVVLHADHCCRSTHSSRRKNDWADLCVMESNCLLCFLRTPVFCFLVLQLRLCENLELYPDAQLQHYRATHEAGKDSLFHIAGSSFIYPEVINARHGVPKCKALKLAKYTHSLCFFEGRSTDHSSFLCLFCTFTHPCLQQKDFLGKASMVYMETMWKKWTG